MPDYRAYIVGRDGRFQDAIALICDDDATAMTQAERLVDGHDVELWQYGRKVHLFKAKNPHGT